MGLSAFERASHYTARGVVERVESAAIRHDGTVYALAPPARHIDVIWFMWEQRRELSMGTDQGFVTSRGRYVGRAEAARIAITAGQIERTQFQTDVLFSEDLW